MSSEHALQATGEAAQDPTPTTWRDTIWLFTLLFLAPTALLFVLSHVVGAMVSWFNVDLLGVYIVAVLIGRRSQALGVAVALVGLAIVILIQALMSIGLVYIQDPALILEYLGFIQFWPWRVIGQYSAMGLAGLFVVWLLLRRIRVGRARILPAVIVLVLAIGVDLLGRTSVGYDLVRTNFATSSVYRGGRVVLSWTNPPDFTVRAFEGSTVRDTLLRSSERPARILSISFESFGTAKESAFDDVEIAPLQQILGEEYVIERSRHAFKGATLAGEIRELCGLEISGTPSASEAKALRTRCVPAHLLQEGYETLGIHGNSRFFYNRTEVYRAIGFNEVLFFDDLKSRGHQVCRTRAFSGICDSETVRAALEFLAKHPKAFAHVMTLDTHFPLGTRKPNDDVCTAGKYSKDLCLYQNQVAMVLGEIAEAVARSPAKPDLIYIFGDHAPPYVMAAERAFFDRRHVPLLTLHRRTTAPSQGVATEGGQQ